MQNNTLKQIKPYVLLDTGGAIAALWVVMVHSCDAYIASGHPEAIRKQRQTHESCSLLQNGDTFESVLFRFFKLCKIAI
jgi:hypothetical protein